jgi:CheY-like chemotaxis protein
MAQLLLVDDDPGTLAGLGIFFRGAGYEVLTALTGREAFDLLELTTVDLIVADYRLPDMSGLHLIRRVQGRLPSPPVLIVAGCVSTRDAVLAMRFGAADFLEKPIDRGALLNAVRAALDGSYDDGDALKEDPPEAREWHAAARWARVLVPVLRARRDPRTIEGWSRVAYVSPGALRNWCRTAGISPRRSLVFARLLRAVILGQGGKHKPEDLLDVVDRRTLVGLLKFAGLDPHVGLPQGVDSFLRLQTLVRDEESLEAIAHLLAPNKEPDFDQRHAEAEEATATR